MNNGNRFCMRHQQICANWFWKLLSSIPIFARIAGATHEQGLFIIVCNSCFRFVFN